MGVLDRGEFFFLSIFFFFFFFLVGYVENLLDRPASLPPHPEEIDAIISETLPIPVHEFTMEELTSAIRSTSSGKATGLDNIPAEVWKSGTLLEHLLNVCTKVFNAGEAPNVWRIAAILPIPKNEDLTNRQNSEE